MESAFAKSTFCRKCGNHFEVGKPLPEEHPAPKEPTWFERLGKLLTGETTREIHCFDCNASQVVSSLAKSSLCPQCGAYMDLRDFKIAGSYGRTIQTQGKVVITSKGDVTSAKIVCAEALIQGKLQGLLVSNGKVRFKMKGRCLGGIEAGHFLIEKRSDVEFVRTVKAKHAEIIGRCSARIMADKVTITPTGTLEGTVYAKAITIEKGGRFSGDLVIGQKELSQPDLIPASEPAPKGRKGNIQGKLALG